MAEKIDEEGNIISPLGSFKKLSTITPAVSQPTAIPVKTPLPVPAQSPHTTPPLASLDRKPSVNITKLCDDRHVWKQRALPGTKPCETAGVITPRLNVFIQNILAKERKEMRQSFDEKYRRLEDNLRGKLKCSCSDKPQIPTDHEPHFSVKSGSATATAVIETADASKNSSDIAPLAGSWINLLAKLRSDNFEQLLNLQKATKDKNKLLATKVSEIKKLKTRIACLVHEDNVDHLERRQTMTSYSTSDCPAIDSMSISNQSVSSQSSISSYKESSCVSSYRQSKPVSGYKQTRSVPSHRARRCSQSLSASSYEQHRSVPSHRTRREADDVEIRRKQQTDYISRIGGTVDTLAKQYSPARYTHVSAKSNYPIEGGPCVLDVFPALCMFAGEEEPTAEELSKYDALLASQLRPPPIYSPTLRKPNVNWSKLNPFQHKNLPKPSMFPVHGCSDDPEFYEKLLEFRDGSGHYRKTLKWNPLKIEELNNGNPFGRNFGFETNMGIVSIPTMPLHGYRCNSSTGEWVIDAIG